MAESQSSNNPGATPPKSEHIEPRAEHAKYDSSAVQSAHGAVDGAAARLHRGADKVASVAGSAAERSRAAYDTAKEHADDWMDDVRQYVRAKPAQSLVIAVAAGWLVGRLIRRH